MNHCLPYQLLVPPVYRSVCQCSVVAVSSVASRSKDGCCLLRLPFRAWRQTCSSRAHARLPRVMWGLCDLEAGRRERCGGTGHFGDNHVRVGSSEKSCLSWALIRHPGVEQHLRMLLVWEYDRSLMCNWRCWLTTPLPHTWNRLTVMDHISPASTKVIDARTSWRGPRFCILMSELYHTPLPADATRDRGLAQMMETGLTCAFL